MNIYRKIILLLAVIVSGAAISSCNDCVRGEGDPVTKTIELEPFNAIHISGSQGVNISQGVEQRVEIKAPENIIHLLNTAVRNNTWEISFEQCVRAGTIEINITTPAIEAITVTGSGSVKGLNNINVEEMSIAIAGSGNVDLILNAKKVVTNISGSGNVKLSGSAINHNINIVGSGEVKAGDFVTVATNVKIAGSGDASVHATELIEASITGSGDVEYIDTGARIVSDISGSGDIVKK